LFRLNAGRVWAGVIVKRTAQLLTLAHYYPIKLAPEGFSDTAGWTSITITPEMVGQRVALFIGCEVKVLPNKPTPAQLSFIDAVVKAGGRAGVAYSTDEAKRIIAGL
jgi:hypothetical protein